MFLDEYVEFASKQTISPEIFHKFIGYSVLGTITGRWAYVQRGPRRCFSNLYHLIVAPSSVGKSTAISVGHKLISEMDRTLLWNANASNEAMFSLMAASNRGIFIEDEFSCFLSHCRKEYASTVKDLLTTCYDSPEYVPPPPRMRTMDAQWLRYPAPSFLASTTEAMLFKCMDASDFMTGFFARFCFICAETPGRESAENPEVDEERHMRSILQETVEWLQETEVPRVIRFSPDARNEFDSWEKSWKNEARHPKYENIESNLIRVATSVMKYSMLGAINRHSMEIDESDVTSAIMMADYSRNSIVNLLADYDIKPQTFAGRLASLRRALRRRGVITEREFNRFFDDPRDMKRAKDTLLSHGMIRTINANGHANSVEWLDPDDADMIAEAERIVEENDNRLQ